MNRFKTISEKCVTAELIEKKSRFIANFFYVETVMQAEEKIKEMKKKYHDAKHNCSAYVVMENNEQVKKFSDDGEPSGTAGAPMLEILEKNNLCNVVIIVTRYFGGILLGTGGLVRAYSESLKRAIDCATLVLEEQGYQIKISIPYSNFEKFKYYCGKLNINIIDSIYSDVINCTIETNKEKLETLENNIKSENEFGILSFDIVRQKNIREMSNKVD